MYRLISVFAVCTAMLMGIVLGIGLTSSPVVNAKVPPTSAADPEGVFRAFASALNNDDSAAAAALLDDDVTFFEPNGDGSFGIVGKAAFVSAALPDLAASGFKTTVRHAQVHGDTVTGRISPEDEFTHAAGVNRYLELFTVRVVDGRIASIDLLYDTGDTQTNTYLEYSRSQSDEEDDGPPSGSFVELPLGPGAHGSQPGTVFVAEAGEGVSFVGVQVQPGHAGTQQPADLVSGSCGAPGEIVYPLAAVVDGGSFTIISASVDELLAQGLSVQVHQAGRTDRVNACGAVLAAAAAPAPPVPAPAPARTDIKPPSTGTGPAPGGGLPSSLLAAVVAAGVLAVLGGLGVRRSQRR